MKMLQASFNAKIMLLRALENDGIYPSHAQKIDLLLLNLKALNEEVNHYDDDLQAFILEPMNETRGIKCN